MGGALGKLLCHSFQTSHIPSRSPLIAHSCTAILLQRASCYRPASFNARKTFSGLNGSFLIRTPVAL